MYYKKTDTNLNLIDMTTYKLDKFKNANGDTRVTVLDMTNAKPCVFDGTLVGKKVFNLGIEELNDQDFIEAYINYEASLSGEEAQELYDFIVDELNPKDMTTINLQFQKADNPISYSQVQELTRFSNLIELPSTSQLTNRLEEEDFDSIIEMLEEGTELIIKG